MGVLCCTVSAALPGPPRSLRQLCYQVLRTMDVETERTRRTARSAQDQETRGDALVSRLALEAEMQRDLRVRIKRALDRAQQDTAKAVIAEAKLADTKVRADCRTGRVHPLLAACRGGLPVPLRLQLGYAPSRTLRHTRGPAFSRCRRRGSTRQCPRAVVGVGGAQVAIEAAKERVDTMTAHVDKLKLRVEFLLTELRRKQLPHRVVGGKWEGAWVPFIAPGIRIEAGAVSVVYRERWTCCDCTCSGSYFCKPFCGCKSIVQQYCEGPPVPPPALPRSPIK
jgi:hypothetical protein